MSTDAVEFEAPHDVAHLQPPIAGAERASRAWRPWRAYATQYLWAVDDHPINHLPQEDS